MFTITVPEKHPLTREDIAQEVWVVSHIEEEGDQRNLAVLCGVYPTVERAFKYIQEWEWAAGETNAVTGPFFDESVTNDLYTVEVNGHQTYRIQKTFYRL
jgi:hypothetical protein